jgi:hypothetical protein
MVVTHGCRKEGPLCVILAGDTHIPLSYTLELFSEYAGKQDKVISACPLFCGGMRPRLHCFTPSSLLATLRAAYSKMQKATHVRGAAYFHLPGSRKERPL